MGPLDYLIAHGVISVAFAIGSAILLNHFTQSINYDWIVWVKGAIVIVAGVIGYMFAMFVWKVIKYIAIAAAIIAALAIVFFAVKSLVSK